MKSKRTNLQWMGSESGFSLIEAMITLAVIGIGALALMQLISTSVLSQKGIKLTDDLTNVIFETRVSLGNKGICPAALLANMVPIFDRTKIASKDFTPIPIKKIQLSGSAEPLVESGKSIKGAPGSLIDLSLYNIQEIKQDLTYVGRIRFAFTKAVVEDANKNLVAAAGQVSGAVHIIRDLPIYLQVTAKGTTETIYDCYTSFGKDLNELDITTIKDVSCQAGGGIFDTASSVCKPGGGGGGAGGKNGSSGTSSGFSGGMGMVGMVQSFPTGNSRYNEKEVRGRPKGSGQIPTGWFDPSGKRHDPADNPGLPECGADALGSITGLDDGTNASRNELVWYDNPGQATPNKQFGGYCFPLGSSCQRAVPINGYQIVTCGGGPPPPEVTAPAQDHSP